MTFKVGDLVGYKHENEEFSYTIIKVMTEQEDPMLYGAWEKTIEQAKIDANNPDKLHTWMYASECFALKNKTLKELLE